MRTRSVDSSSKSATPPARKSAGETSSTRRTPVSRARKVKKTETSPAPDPLPLVPLTSTINRNLLSLSRKHKLHSLYKQDSNPEQSPEQKPEASATTSNSGKRKTPGRPRTKVVAVTSNLEEHLVAEADENQFVDNSEAAERVEEPGNVEKGCELVGKGKSMAGVEVFASPDASVSFKRRPIIVDLNISVADNEDYSCSKEGERGNEELKEQEGGQDLDDKEDSKEPPEETESLDEKHMELEAIAKQPKQRGLEKEKGEDTNINGNEEHSIAEKHGVEVPKSDELLDLGEQGRDDLDDEEDPEETETLEEEHMELEAIAKQKEQSGLEKAKGVKGPTSGEMVDLGEQGRNGLDDVEDLKEPPEETETLEEKHMELEAIAKQQKQSGLEKAKGEETNIIGNEEHSNVKFLSIEVKAQLQKDVHPEKLGVEGPISGEMLDLGEQEREDADDEEDQEEPPEETETLEEHMEVEAIAKQRRIKKEHEIFVGGLDRDATEEDLRKVFQRIGEVVEVRLHINSSTNKNKGYAFVKFASKEHAKKALSEMKNPVIHGKRCGTAPSEDNDTLFLGNICNTWTKEAIKQKLKDYSVEGVENITLVPDVQHEGLSRGFAFLEFSCHADAMIAYKRLQKPDVIFGHVERTAKVAFAEPVREPDPEIMAQVKSVFINGLPPHWDEDHVRELIKSYGAIVRIVLARNMPTAKRKDYGFVDFSTHEAAAACVDGINKSELGGGASKIKVRARLSNPLPKTQVVKGGMCGGFRIGHARSGTFPRSGRGFGRGKQPFNWGNFNRGRGRGRSFYHRGVHGQMGRMDFGDDHDFNMYLEFHQRQFGPQETPRGGYHASSRGAAYGDPSMQYPDRAWYGIPDAGPGEPIPPRRPYPPGGQFDGPFLGRHIDDPYFYDDNMHGMKRPFYMTDPEPDYMGPSRFRPRMDYADPFHGIYHDYVGAGSRQYPHDYYGSDHGGGPYSSFYGGYGPQGYGYYY